MAAPIPKKDIDWTNLPPKEHVSVNGHIETRFRATTGQWSTPMLIAGTDISVSGLSPGLNYGQQCYEGLKAFRTAEGTVTVFRPQFHAARMQRSAASICLPPPPEDLFLECVRRAVAENAEFVPPSEMDAFLYIRPVLFGASTGLWGPCDETVLAVYVHPAKALHGMDAVAGVVCDEFDRCAPRGTGSFKIGGNYAPVWRHVAKAAMLGYGIVLHLDSATHSFVEEFSTSAFLGHKIAEDGRHVLVVPDTDNAIRSTTSDSLVRLAETAGWIIERLPFSSLSDLDEVISCGSAAAATPIKSIERLATGEKYVFGPTDGDWYLMQLAKVLTGVQRGTNEDMEAWCWEITGFPVDVPVDAKVEGRGVQVSSSKIAWGTLSSMKTFMYLVSPLRVYQGVRGGLRAVWE